ncbi:hypothetical protein [Streptomyces sp. AK02-01A]|uniref:hypothetical protein n=1 Tax=Streptomyces sp. AK02-01A TaxID=3028648 RepID=UPI0029B3E7D9|nr:hypothetical protein [Streptomyces sp. AK02-01A]MDX3855841.1 hypothetical protein [Streptomyces sp. AK02-01A]
MTGQGRTARGPHGGARRCAAVLWLAALLLASACSAPSKTPDAATGAVRAVLDRWAAAVLDRDEHAYLAALDPAATALRATARAEFENLAEVPLGSWEYRLTDVARAGGRATVRAELRYRLDGYDSAPVSTPRVLELGERAGRWYVTGDRPDKGGTRQLWEQGAVRAVRGAGGLVLGVGQSDERLRGIADSAGLAVPAVDDAWPGSWSRRVVVFVPGSLEAMGGLLGASPAGYRGIAAVTTGETGGAGASPADRIIVNPDAYGALGDFGRRIVLTHETTHVATRAATSAATPTWLSEGFADWVAYRGTDRPAGRIAPELQLAVRRGEPPAALPSDEDFAFGGDADRLARSYESGWLACELIAGDWGEKRLTDFYRAVGAHGGRDGAVEKAMNDVLSTTPDDFTARWRAYLRERLA